jgi:hypothetical protein
MGHVMIVATRSATRRRVARRGTEAMARVGLASEGVLYALVGVLALLLATGDWGTEAGPEGAVEALARQPYGRAALVVLGIGFALNAVWRLLLAWRGNSKVADALHGLIYAALAFLSFRVVTRASGTSGTGGTESERATATVLTWPAGPLLVAAAGAAVVALGVWQWRQPVTKDFLRLLRTDRMSDRTLTAVTVIGSVGYAARGVAFALVGWFLVRAAIDHDPGKGGGLDVALGELVREPYGPWLVGAVGVGLLAFAAFRFVDAAYRSPART